MGWNLSSLFARAVDTSSTQSALPTSSSEVEMYSLLLQSFTRDGAVTGEVSLTFEVKSTNKTLIIAGSIGAVSCAPLCPDRSMCGRHAAMR